MPAKDYNSYMNDYMKRRYATRRESAIERLGGICVKCGTNENLEFDHIYPHTKDFTVARASSFSEARWNEEISKCQLLCSTCHREKHASVNPHGDVKKYWQGCRCDLCRAAKSQYDRTYREQRKEPSRRNS